MVMITQSKVPERSIRDGGPGGASGGTPQTSAEIYNPGANVWTAAASLAHGRARGQAVRLNDGSVLVQGGSNASGAEVAAVERYQP